MIPWYQNIIIIYYNGSYIWSDRNIKRSVGNIIGLFTIVFLILNELNGNCKEMFYF